MGPADALLHKNTTVIPGSIFKPMLSSRNQRDFNDIVSTMAKYRLDTNPDSVDNTYDDPDRYGPKEFIIEEKLDGARLQLHKIGDNYQYFTR